jgi:hypothetical protein
VVQLVDTPDASPVPKLSQGNQVVFESSHGHLKIAMIISGRFIFVMNWPFLSGQMLLPVASEVYWLAALQRGNPVHLIPVGDAAVVLTPWTLLRVSEKVRACDVVVDTDFSTVQATEKFFRPIRACTILWIGLLMVDPFNFKSFMKVVPWSRLICTHNRSLRNAGTSECGGLAFGIEHGGDGVASTFPNYHHNLAVAVLVPGKPAVAAVFFLISGFDVAAQIAAIRFGLFAFTADDAALHFFCHGSRSLCRSTNADL